MLLGQISAVGDPLIRSRCKNLVARFVSRGGLRILAGRSIKPVEQLWINAIARSDPKTMMAALQEWGGADDDAAWRRTLRLLLGMSDLAGKDREWVEARLLRSSAEPRLEAEPLDIASSMVARVFNEHKWILNFSDDFSVLGPKAVSAALSFLENNVPGSPEASARRSPKESPALLEDVVRWLYVATRLEQRGRAGELPVAEAYLLKPALRRAALALSEATDGGPPHRVVSLEASATKVAEHILTWCDRWHGYGAAPAFKLDMSYRPFDHYYRLAVMVDLLPHTSAVVRQRIVACIEAEIRWIRRAHALTVIGALIENAEPDELDGITAATGIDREDPHWIHALQFAHADFAAGAPHCDLRTAVLRYPVNLAFQGPSELLLGLAELSAHSDAIVAHARFDIAPLLAGVVDSARESTIRP
ncbi:hypothetical protein KDL01_29175 [Actinospica durhamensis]|uniref:Uncharacterized protein n=1 Tax=Actinospica durhamensis TaxID=1508375 RepID=A0A941ITA1_9ACTN|nr:hypothetical protein [Actinospica durhamensis]MBR7837387.1 hypothetical protein [Actinospica durhamensis]